MANSLNILNSIRSVATQDYIERIPEATRENIKTVGNTILSYTPFTNTFFSNLINRIGKVVVNKLTPLSDIYGVFGEEKLDYGDTIQEIFIDLVKVYCLKFGAINNNIWKIKQFCKSHKIWYFSCCFLEKTKNSGFSKQYVLLII